MDDAVFEKAKGIRQKIVQLRKSLGEVQSILNNTHLFGVPLDMIRRWLKEWEETRDAEILRLKKEFDEL